MTKHRTPSAWYGFADNPMLIVANGLVSCYTQVNMEVMGGKVSRTVVGDIEGGIGVWVQMVLFPVFDKPLNGFSN